MVSSLRPVVSIHPVSANWYLPCLVDDGASSRVKWFDLERLIPRVTFSKFIQVIYALEWVDAIKICPQTSSFAFSELNFSSASSRSTQLTLNNQPHQNESHWSLLQFSDPIFTLCKFIPAHPRIVALFETLFMSVAKQEANFHFWPRTPSPESIWAFQLQMKVLEKAAAWLC